MIPLPSESTDILKLADWLELYAVMSPDGDSSRGDLNSALATPGLYDLEDEDEALEQTTSAVFIELENRQRAAKDAYPFVVQPPSLMVRNRWQDYPVYMFCLCLSYCGAEDQGPRKLFEQISSTAAKAFLGGDSVPFGAPRTILPSNFYEALAELTRRIGEGEGARRHPALSPQDGKLDIVAWRDFEDRLPGKIILFGQCASGRNWFDKVSELDLGTFSDLWFQTPPLSRLLKSFFVPHRIDSNRWEMVTRYAGIVFDRCRIAHWAHGGADYSSLVDWIKERIELLQRKPR